MRAVKGDLGHSLERDVKRSGRLSLGLMARLGVPVGGRVRKPRAVEDQSAPIPRERTSKLGGTILVARCDLARGTARLGAPGLGG